MRESTAYTRVADMPPGPELAAALAMMVLAEVPNAQVIDLLRAHARQLAHEQARMSAAMVEVSRTTPGAGPDPRRAGEPYPWAAIIAIDPDQARSRETARTRPGDEPRTGIEIRVGLMTLLGLDDRPGEIAGLGPACADVARTTVARQHTGAQWRFAVTDPDGHLLLAGPIRRRPGLGPEPDGACCLGGVVEIQVPAAELDRLVGDGAMIGVWDGVASDIAEQYARRNAVAAAMDRHPAGRYARKRRHSHHLSRPSITSPRRSGQRAAGSAFAETSRTAQRSEHRPQAFPVTDSR